MRIVICDGDTLFVDDFKKILVDYFETSFNNQPEIIIYTNGEDLLSDPNIADIVFLDIVLSKTNGIDVGRQLKKANKNIIIFIVTAYIHYMDDAMDIQPFRYMTKPISKSRLTNSMDKALKRYHSIVKKITIDTGSEVYAINSNDIVMVKIEGGNINVYTEKSVYSSVHNFAYWTSVLNLPSFFVSYRSCIVNFRYISYFDKETIQLCDGRYEAYLTKRKYTEFKKAYLLYVESM